MTSIVIGLDFDGTCVGHKYPDIGKEVPDAVRVLKRLQECGHCIMLWTMRVDSPKEGPVLTDAVKWLTDRGISVWGVCENPQQKSRGWSKGNKQFAHIYIDDAALGCPLLDPATNQPLTDYLEAKERPIVDWKTIEKMLAARGVLPPLAQHGQ